MELGSRDVEDLLGTRLGLDPERRIAFRGRLDHLRKLGCPRGVKTGKGRAAVFGWTQVVELAVALDLINLGMTPENAAAVIEAHNESLGIAALRLTQLIGSGKAMARAVKEEKWPISKTVFLLIDVGALSAFKKDGSLDRPSVGLQEGKYMVEWLRSASAFEAANIVIDFGTKVAQLMRLVSIWANSEIADVVADFSEWADQSVHP